MQFGHPTKRLPLRSSEPRSRPCLPQVEQLGDRLLFSVIVNTTAADTLVHLVQGQVPIVSDALAVLDQAADLVTTDSPEKKAVYNELSTELIKLEDAIFGLG